MRETAGDSQNVVTEEAAMPDTPATQHHNEPALKHARKYFARLYVNRRLVKPYFSLAAWLVD
jgi:hypothetical protein